jgi:NADH/NAD ratio-sensing transcriptional regulator Rex
MASALAIVGKVAFVVGVLFAIVGGIWGGVSIPTNDLVIWVLLVAGILIGLLNVTAKEGATVLAAAVALIILGIWGFTPAAAPIADISVKLAENLQGVVCAFALLMAPAAIIVAIKAVISTAKPGD